MILEGHHLDVGAIESARRRVGSEQYGLAARQDVRPAMRNLSRSQLRQRLVRAAVIGNSRQNAALGSERRDDVVVVTPSAAARSRSVAQRLRSAAFHRNLFELSASEECNPLPVRREERTIRSFRSGQLGSLVLIETAG